ncbi:unnamed protein product [Cylicocyclus nassatus]|uniref:Uncharacterized protein n=1 Tax=Cylicocyclus nassatus TaxID=53992 RepID=A0AA36GUS7_CYLNA|nr:unnamed protein product [Cylicocyclus nassatus]
MLSEYDVDPEGSTCGGVLFDEQVYPSTSGISAGQVVPRYVVAEDDAWIQSLSDVIYQEDTRPSPGDTHYEDVQTFNQVHAGDEVYLMHDGREFDELAESVETLQVAAHEVVEDEMVQGQVEPIEYIQSLPGEVVQDVPTYLESSQIIPMAEDTRVRYIVQQQPQLYEVPQNAPLRYEIRPKAMFEGTSCQRITPVKQMPISVNRSRSKSLPRRPVLDPEDASLVHLTQEYDEAEWDGVELEDHEYFVGEGCAIMADDDGGSNLSAPKIQQRPYFPPNLSPTEKKDYLLANYKKACERYFPFANTAMLAKETIYKPTEAFASDLYRFHARGAHIHGFFRTVIDSRDPPSNDQTRYIQDIQFGKVFPLFPDYDEWDKQMKDDFRQLSSRLLKLFERKCFYANAKSGVGKIPPVKRGARPQPKPPPDYVEQQKITSEGLPKGFHSVRASAKKVNQPISETQANTVTATRLKELPQASSLTEQVPVPEEVGAARVEALQYNKRANVRRLVDDAFMTREQEAPLVEYEALPSDPRTFICRVPPGPSKTLRDQRSTGRKAVRMIQNGTIEASIDGSGRYVVNLDDIRGQRSIAQAMDAARYVHRSAYSLREMAASARRGAANYANVQARVRAQGPRYSRIGQVPQYIYSSDTTLAHDQLSENIAPMRNTVRSDVYQRSRSCGRVTQTEAPAYRRSASSGRKCFESRNVPDSAHFDEEDHNVEGPLTRIVYTNDPSTSIDQNNTADVIVTQSRDENPGVPSQSRDHAEQNSAPSSSLVKNQKRGVLLRDENGRLRRGYKLPDGTIILGKPRYKQPMAGGVYVLHSMGRNDGRGDQWRRTQEPFGSLGRTQEEILRTDSHNVKNKTRRTKQSRSEAAPEIDSAPKTESRGRRRFSARHCAIDQISPHRIPQWSEEELKNFNRKRLLKQKEEDEENIFVDVVSTDSTTEESILELIAPAPPPPTANGISDASNAKKPGRPHKKYRGRLARQKQAIKDAEIAEKIAIKHRELPVLDLTLKIIEDPSLKEALPILLHEVGDVLKEMIAQVSLEDLEPKRDIKPRYRRTWDYLPRIRSKRQEYKKQNVPVSERSPSPPPLTVKPRGRNAEKYRKPIAEQQHDHDENLSPNGGPTTKAPFENETSEDSKSSEAKVLPDSIAPSEEHEPEPQEVNLLSTETTINEDDLVDVLDPFFSDALTMSNEVETQSHSLYMFQKSINDITLATDASPLKEQSKIEKRVSVTEVLTELSRASDGRPSADLSDEVPKTSLGTEGLSFDAEPLETTYMTEEHGDLCRRVEAMLDVLQNFCEETAGVFVHVGSSANAYNDERLPYLQNEPAITNSLKSEPDNLLLRAKEPDTQNLENELSEGRVVSEVVAEPVLFEAKAPPQLLSTACSLAIANFEEDRLYTSANVDVDFSRMTKPGESEASASYTHDSIAVEKAYLSVCWEENFIEGAFDLYKEDESVDIDGHIPLIAQELEVLSVIDLDSTLVAVAPVDKPLVLGESLTLYETVSINDKTALYTSSVDLAFERSVVELESICFYTPIAEEEAALLSIVDLKASLYLEEQHDGASKSFPIPRVGDRVEDTRYATSVMKNLVSERAPARSINLDSILGKTISKDFLGFLLKLLKVIGTVLAESFPRATETLTHLVRSPLKRKYVADGSGEEYELPSKRKKLASDDSAQFSSFQALNVDLSKELELVDTTPSEFLTKLKRRKTVKKHRAPIIHKKKDRYVHPPQHGSTATAEIDAISERTRSKEVVKRKEAEAVTTTHHQDKPRTVLRIRRPTTEFNIKRVEPDCGCDTNIGFFGRRLLVAYRKSRERNYQISDFNLTNVRTRNPVVKYDIDVAPLMESLNPVSPSCLSLPRAEGSLEDAVEQFEKGIGCILNQLDHARTITENLRDKMHWSLHFLTDAQLFFLDILYELWGFTARFVQIAVFSVYQTCLWEKHSELFDARMCRLLFEMNASASLSCDIGMCASYLRGFEEWCRELSNFTSIYNHVHGLALSLIKLITVPDFLKRLQRKTFWNSKALPFKESEELFTIDLAPYFQIGTCPSEGKEFDLTKALDVRMPLVNTMLKDLIDFETAQDSSSHDVFSFLFPSQAIVELCQKQISDEIQAYYHSHNMKSITSLSNRDLYVLSPTARAYIVSRVTEARARSHMRNHVMNIEKLIEKLNSFYADLETSVNLHNEAEFSYPCGQIVFGFDGGSVSVCVNKPIPADVPQLSSEAMEEAQRIMGSGVGNTVFHPSTRKQDGSSEKSSGMKKPLEAVKYWLATIPEEAMEEVEDAEMQAPSGHEDEESMDIVYPSSPARVQVIDDENDDTELESYQSPSRKCCDADSFTKVIAGRKILYTVDCEQGFVKLKTVDSKASDEPTDDLATSTFSTASFNSYDKIETLRIIRSKETGELDWMTMIQNTLEAPPFPETLPRFLLKKELSDRRILDAMKCHEYANHFVHETDESGEFLDQRKEMREKIKQFQMIDYYERRRNAKFEKISSSTPLEMPRPRLLDQFPAYGIWVHKVALYAEEEKKRLIGLKPFDNEPCRAARPELVRGLAEPKKQKKRTASAMSWLGRTMHEHFGDYLELGMSRLQYEKAQSGTEGDRALSPPDAITNLFVNRSNGTMTPVDPAELIEKPYAYFRPTNPSRKRRASPVLLESTLVKRFPECPVLAPLGVADDDKENILPPEPDGSSSDDDEDD